jgi:TetR/AcrR family transcriptional regulator
MHAVAVPDHRKARRDHERGVSTRHALLDSALHEFAASGFEAASTRAIAARAGVRQSQLTYHFDSKDVLWRAAVDHLFGRFDHEFVAALGAGPDDPASLFARSIRALVRAVSRLPELNRIMVHEATSDSERLAWIVECHVRARFEQLETLWSAVRASGGTDLDADPVIIYYTVLGAASLLYVNAAEARRLVGSTGSHDLIDDELIEAHADTLVAMLLGAGPSRSRPRTAKGR